MTLDKKIIDLMTDKQKVFINIMHQYPLWFDDSVRQYNKVYSRELAETDSNIKAYKKANAFIDVYYKKLTGE
jgi:hypothetical protein